MRFILRLIAWIAIIFLVFELVMVFPYRDAHRLIEAVEEGPAAVEQVLKDGADPNTPTGPYKGGWRRFNSFFENGVDYPLSEACLNGDLESVRLMLEYGADPALTQDEGVGWSTMESAILGSRHPDCVEIVKLLMENGMDPMAYSGSYHPAELAAMQYPLPENPGEAERITELVDLLMGELDVNENGGLTLLMQAAIRDNGPLTEYLLSVGADPFLESSTGMTALDYAVERGHADVARILSDAMK